MNDFIRRFKKTIKTLALDAISSVVCFAFLIWLILPHQEKTRNAF